MKSSLVFTKATIGRIRTMQDSGSTNRQIAEAIGSTEGSVASRTSQLGLSRNPQHPLEKHTRVAIPEKVIARCAPHAAQRDLSPSDLIRRLVERIAQDNLFEAVLDDGSS